MKLGLIDTVRVTMGTALQALSALGASEPIWLTLGASVLLIPLYFAARLTGDKHQKAFIPRGAAWLTSALAVATPLVLLWLADRLMALSGVPSLENRLLEYFSDRHLLPVPPGGTRPVLPPLTMPAAAALTLVGAFAFTGYYRLYARGGLGVTKEGEEAHGLMRLAGHWGNTGVERRFGLWAAPVARNLWGFIALSGLGAVFGHFPPVLWVAAVVLTHGFAMATRDALNAQKRQEDAKKADEEGAPKKDQEASADELEQRIGRALGASPFLAHAQDASEGVTSEPEVPSNELFREILAGLGIEAMYRHQAQAVEAHFAGSDLLLCTSPGSGRSAVRDAVAMHAVLAGGVSVLYLCRDAGEAEQAHRVFRERSEKAHWRWNVPALLLSGREDLDLDRSQPSIIFAGWADAHARLLADAPRYGFFLRSLALVAVPRLDAYQGPSADHLTYLLARLRRAADEAAGPSRAARPGGPKLLMIADPISPDIARLAERVAGGRVVVVGEESDGAPVSAQRHVWLTRPDGSRPDAAELASELRRARIPFTAVGLDLELGAEGRATDAKNARAVLARAEAASVAQLPLMLRHFGHTGGSEAPVIVFWIPGDDPLSRLLPGARGAGLTKRLSAPRMVMGGASAWIASDHARCAVAEAEWPVEALEASFGAAPARQALEAMRAAGHVSLETRPEIDPAENSVRTREFARARKLRPHGEVTLGVVGKGLKLEDRSTAQLLQVVPSDRALAAAYPERVVIAGGRRYRVLPVASQERREQGVLWAEAEPRRLATFPVRRIELEPLVDRRRGDAGAPAGGDRRAPARRALAGREFSLAWPRVRISEKLQGFRNIERRAVVDAGFFPEAVEGVHDGRAAILGLPAAAGWNPTPAGMHALAHLYRTVLPAVLRAGPDDLDVADVTWAGEPAIAFVDLHPGGAGFAEAITLDAVRSLSTLALAVVRGCECRKVAGCPNCVRIAECGSGFGADDARTPSRREAERLLCEVLDHALVDAGDAIEYEDGANGGGEPASAQRLGS